MNHKRQHIILLALALALLLGLSSTIVSAQGNGPPPGISYQGRVTVDGQPFDGTGFFMFAIVDSQGQLTWTSDSPVGAQSGTQLPAPTQPIALPVNRGLFSVRLGEFGLMNLIPSQALLDPQSSLRVWFSSNGGDFTQLPDRALAAAPYAMNAYALDGYEVSDFAPAGHDHWGETWSGSGTGLELDSSDGVGVYGVMGAKSGKPAFGAGVWGDSADKPGVWGTSNAASGVVGFSTDNYGVGGVSTNNAGVYGSAPVTGTIGVATNGNGPTWGVYGKSDAPSGYGVYGENTSAGETFGVYGKNHSDHGAGVFGVSSHQDGIGVHGETISGHGVEGIVDWTKGGIGVGVYGSGGFYGTAGFFENASATKTTLIVNNLEAANAGVALDVTGTARFEQGGVYIDDDNGDGIFINHASFYGVHIPKTDLSGIVIEDAGGAATLVMPEEVWPYDQTRDGIDIYGAADHGIFIGDAGRSGIEVNHVAGHGLEVWNAELSGVQVLQAGTHGGYFNGQQDGVDAETASSDQEWGVTTEDKMYAGAGYTSGGAMMLVAKSGGEGNLETGDVVAVTGMASVPGESQNPIPLVQRAGKGNASATIGVVYRRFVFEKHVETFRREGKVDQHTAISTHSADGAIAPGDYLLIVVLGPAQVKVDASAAIHAGDPVTAADSGRAMKATPLQVDGVEFYAPNTVIGKAMEPLKQGRRLIYVFVTLR